MTQQTHSCRCRNDSSFVSESCTVTRCIGYVSFFFFANNILTLCITFIYGPLPKYVIYSIHTSLLAILPERSYLRKVFFHFWEYCDSWKWLPVRTLCDDKSWCRLQMLVLCQNIPFGKNLVYATCMSVGLNHIRKSLLNQ